MPLAPLRRLVIGPLAGSVKNAATAAESWALNAPTLTAELAAVGAKAEGGMVVGDLPHLALRMAEMYGWFKVGEMVGRGNVYGYWL